MEVQYVGRTGPFVKVVDILSDDRDAEMLLEASNQAVSVVGSYVEELATASVVEVVDECGISAETVGACHIHYGVFVPEATAVAESGDAAFGADAGSCEDYEERKGIHDEVKYNSVPQR